MSTFSVKQGGEEEEEISHFLDVFLCRISFVLHVVYVLKVFSVLEWILEKKREKMGKATRWLKGLLGMKKEKENVDNFSNYSAEKKEKKRWSFAKSGKGPVEVGQVAKNVPGNIPVSADDTAWLRSFMAESEKDQNKHAIAVAAATAAAADAAVAAAQAAVAVVRLTSQGRGKLFNGSREKFAAIKIQTFFRGYLVSHFFKFFMDKK